MLAHLEQRFELLVSRQRDLPARHRTLRAAVEGSYQLLPPELRRLLARLSVFRGGWTLEAAEAVCSDFGFRVPITHFVGTRRLDFGLPATAKTPEDRTSLPDPIQNPNAQTRGPAPRFAPPPEIQNTLDGLERLREASLVLAEEQGDAVRYRLLETLREYAWERLAESGELDVVRERHRRWYLLLAEQAAAQFRGPEEGAGLQRIEAEYDNLRAALDWSQLHPGEESLRLGGALWWFWWLRGYSQEGRQRLTALLGGAPGAPQAPTAARARALAGAGAMAFMQGDYREAGARLAGSLAMGREVGDRLSPALSLLLLGIGQHLGGDLAPARGQLEASLALWRELGDAWGIAWSLANLGGIASFEGDYAAARSWCTESLTVARQAGLRQVTAYAAAAGLARAAVREREFEAAAALLREALPVLVDLDDRWALPIALEQFADLAAAQGQRQRAAHLLGAAAAFRAARRVPRPRVLEAYLDLWLQPARQALGEAAWSAALAEGRTMTLEQAAAYAVEAETQVS